MAFRLHENAEKKSGAVVQTKHSSSSPPNPHLDRAGSSGAPGAGGLGHCTTSAPSLFCLVFAVFQRHRKHSHIANHPLATPARGGGGLPLPAAAAAAPFFKNKNQGIEKK